MRFLKPGSETSMSPPRLWMNSLSMRSMDSPPGVAALSLSAAFFAFLAAFASLLFLRYSSCSFFGGASSRPAFLPAGRYFWLSECSLRTSFLAVSFVQTAGLTTISHYGSA